MWVGPYSGPFSAFPGENRPWAYSSSRVASDVPPCFERPRPRYLYTVPVEGSIAGGSSGSPTITSGGQVVAHLRGLYRIWVVSGGLTNVRTVVRVRDTQEEITKTYINPQDTPFQPIQDVGAFATCP